MIARGKSRTTTGLKMTARWLIGAAVALYCATFIAWKAGVDPAALFEWSDRTYAVIEPVRWYLALARIAAIALAWWFWPQMVVRWFPENLPGYATNRDLWMSLRSRVAFAFLFLEACIHISYLGSIG